MTNANAALASGFHEVDAKSAPTSLDINTPFSYTFHAFSNPFVGDMIQELNQEDSLRGLLDPGWQESNADKAYFSNSYRPNSTALIKVDSSPREIEVDLGQSYSDYHWELFFFTPLTIAVHLSKAQRFAEAQRWFHYIFDPRSRDSSTDPKRFWKFLAFRKDSSLTQIGDLLSLLSAKADSEEARRVVRSYHAILTNPFQPHVVARTRLVAYRYYVVMKYLDNLIAWGDHLFQQDTLESVNEATLLYVLASNILGPRPQRIPPRGQVEAKTFAQLKDLDPMGNALVELEGQFPFNLAPASSGNGNGAAPLFGIGQTLYFSIPRNDKLLSYWDTVGDRLFKIRHCMNIAGVVRQLALFDPPLDPGLLVKAAASGIDIGSAVNGLFQPTGPIRSLTLIQKALELCGEVRNLGGALLSALEKGDSEHLSLIRQRHEIQIQQMSQDVRFLQWKSTQENTKSLLNTRATALERFHYYQRLLGLPDDPNAPQTVSLDQRELTEENFDEQYADLVGQYDKQITTQKLSELRTVGANAPAVQSGSSGAGNLCLIANENADLNVHGPLAHFFRQNAMAIETIHAPLAFIPDVNIDTEFWGIGTHAMIFGGSMLANFGRFLSGVANMAASEEEYAAARASKTAGYQRRADDWILQYNLAAHELMQNGRQILTSLIAEQIARHEYLNIQQQIKNAQEVDDFLHNKFTSEELYLWMQGEISRLYYEYYRFAFDTARRAERAMKQELMRPELDAQDFIKFNYWDGGRKGLLSAEALHLDVKRMEMAYHDNNKRELELTRHVSLRQLDPLALLKLKIEGGCDVTIPEWLYDRDCPGHYMRRIKSVALSIPSVVGAYTTVNCTLSLQRSTLRKSPIINGDYARQGVDDDRFVDYPGATQSIVTSTGTNDSGMFETNLRDERFLPFECAGAESTWKLDLPKDYKPFDYATISDVILHIRYTARQGVDAVTVKNALDQIFAAAAGTNLALVFSLPHDFATEWSAFVNATDTTTPLKITIRREFFPYFTQGSTITITGIELYGDAAAKHHVVGDPNAATTDLGSTKLAFTITAPEDATGQSPVLIRSRTAPVFLLIRYSI